MEKGNEFDVVGVDDEITLDDGDQEDLDGGFNVVFGFWYN